MTSSYEHHEHSKGDGFAFDATRKQNDELVELDNEIDELLHKIYGQQMVYDKQ